jgi:hypothetical protein
LPLAGYAFTAHKKRKKSSEHQPLVIVLRIIINMEADDENIQGLSVCRLLPDIRLHQPDERSCA